MEKSKKIVIAGVTGQLGGRIARILLNQNIAVTALVRSETQATQVRSDFPGSEVRVVDYGTGAGLTDAVSGARCIISALSGLSSVILDAQTRLAEAAITAGVERFVPSDFSVDYRGLERDGTNRNLDLRRVFQRRLDDMPLQSSSVLNGAFLDMLTGQMPIILFGLRRVFCVGDPDQPYDFTTIDDTARYTAAVALDDRAPRWLRIAGEQISPRNLADLLSDITGKKFGLLGPISLKTFDRMIRLTKLTTSTSNALYPPWQGMQYLRDMSSGAVAMHTLDNDRYGPAGFRTARDLLGAFLDGKEPSIRFA